MRRSTSPRAGTRPRFSVVSAVYNVGRFLDEFIDAVERQSFDLGQVEILMVDDGSTDDSLARLEAWRDRRPELVTVLHKDNGGQSSARNLGMAAATGEWITFPDPDDILEPDYLENVDRFIGLRPEVELVAARRITFFDETGERQKHPLDKHFTSRDRLRNLDIDSGHFHGSAPCAFFRLNELRRQELTFDDRIKPTFEDGHFCCRYLLNVGVPWVGYVQSAVYLYRRRADGSSTLDLSWMDPRRFRDTVRFGFLGLLHEATEQRGTVPGWLQSMVLYELSWYFKTEDRVPWMATAAHGEVAEDFVAALQELTTYLDPGLVEAYPARRLNSTYRDLLLHAYRDGAWHASWALVDKIDLKQRTLRVRFRYTGPAPQVTYVVNGAVTDVLHRKVQALRYFEHDSMFEMIAWLPFGTVEVHVEGQPLSVGVAEPEQPTPRLDSWVIRRLIDPSTIARLEREAPSLSRRDRLVLRLADSRLVKRRFRHAWVLMDRIHEADDSGEHLFRYLRRKQRGTNAWFVIQSDTADHRRLRRSRTRRVVTHGSLRWTLLMLNAEHLISSHLDHPIVRPEAITRLRPPRWRFTFLQHGVIKDDLSRWLNMKDIDVLVTSTPAETASIVGDGSPYQLTSREVHRTGLPRFDGLRAQAAKYGPDKRDLVLLAPTWRSWLMGASRGAHERHAESSRLVESDFWRNWGAVVGSEKLRAIAEERGLKVGLLMHPNLQSAVAGLDVPDHVTLLSFEGRQVQQTFARAAVFVTDYSSMAFNAAYIDRPVVYFHFDADRFFGGGHLGRLGYFDFSRDGFGPVTGTADGVVDAVTAALAHGPEPAPEYRARIEAAFPDRDGRCCERTYLAIRESAQRVEAGPALAAERVVRGVGTAPADLVDTVAGLTDEDAATATSVPILDTVPLDPDEIAAEAIAAPDGDGGVADTQRNPLLD